MVRLFGRCLPIVCLPRKKRQSFPICEQETTGTKHQGEINKLFVRRVESIRVTHQGAGLKRLPMQTIAERRSERKKTKCKSPHRNQEKLIKPDDTEFDCETHISDRQSKPKNRIKSKKKPSSDKDEPKQTVPSRSRTPLEKFFNKNKKIKSPSPAPSSAADIPDEDDTTSSISSSSSISSDWSTTTYPDSQSSDNPIQRRQSLPVTTEPTTTSKMKHRSCVESFYLSREHMRATASPLQTKKSVAKIKEQKNEKKSSPRQETKPTADYKPPVKSKQVLQNVRKMIKDQNSQDQHFNRTRQRESARL